MTLFAMLAIFWIFIRTVKYEFLSSSSTINRWLWYLYYIPIIFMPLLMFLSTLYIGKTDSSQVSKKWRAIFVFGAVLSLLVLTNDYHQLAFSFNYGIDNWHMGYSRGSVYYIVVAFVTLILISILYSVFKICTKKLFVKYLWMPLSVIVIGVIYGILYISGESAEGIKVYYLFNLPETICLLSMLFWESLVSAHMIPVNVNHKEFFEESSINAGITDVDYVIRYNSKNSIVPFSEQIKSATEKPILIENGNTLLKCFAVSGGYFFWSEDFRSINTINEKLADTEDYLAEENAMLDAAAKIEEGRRQIAEQNRIYNSVTRQIQPQLKRIEKIIDNLPEDEEQFRLTMKHAGVLSAYIKRFSNLLLLAGTSDYISSEELGIAIAESLEYVKLLDIDCFSNVQEGIELSAPVALLLFELYETALEEALPNASAVLVTVKKIEESVKFYMELGTPSVKLLSDWESESLKRLNASLIVEADEESESITLELALGGDSV